MKEKKESHEETENKGWLLPYSDMLTLLLALFIVMFAMSQVDKGKFKNISKQFNVIFAGGSGILVSDGESSSSKHKLTTAENNIGIVEQNKMLEMKDALEQEIKNSGYDDKIKVELDGEGLNISIQDTVLFNSGDAEILNSFYPVLNQISNMVKKLDNDIKICGYTDNVPISKSNNKFRSNWDLSYMRGSNVMNFMVNTGHISQNKFSIQAYGEYKPKYDNSTEDGKAKNRRVEIIIIRKFLSEYQKTIK